MAKRKLPPRQGKPKRYDFETPLDPFEGESLKGIAAFIESSLTLQSPSPDLQHVDSTHLPSEHRSGDNQLTATMQQRTIMSTLNTTAESGTTDGPKPAATAWPVEIDEPLAVLSALDMTALSTRDTRVTSSPIMPVLGTLDTYGEATNEISTDECNLPTGLHINTDVIGELDTNVLGDLDTTISGTPITCVPSRLDTTSIARGVCYGDKTNDLLKPCPVPEAKPTPYHIEPSILDTQMDVVAPLSGKGTSNTPASGVPDTSHPIFTDQAPLSLSPPQARVDGAATSAQDVRQLSCASSIPITGGPNAIRRFGQTVLREGLADIPSTPAPSQEPPIADAVIRLRQGGADADLQQHESSLHSERTIFVKVHSAMRGQDGLTKGEERIYTFLWRTVFGSKEHSKPDFRVAGDTIEISLRKLAQKVGLGLANCAWHIPCLEEKGCLLRVKESDHFHAAIYRIRQFSEILQWRREHGLTHFIQRGHLATFVDPKTGAPITRFRGQTGTIYRGRLIPSTPNIITHGVLNTNDLSVPDTRQNYINSNTPPVPDSSTEGVINSRTDLLKRNPLKENKPKLTSSTSFLMPGDLVTTLHPLLPSLDDEAVFLLWSECQSRVPDCTVAEIVHFVEAKAAILKTGRIQNPAGFLIAAVPKCFEGESFQQFRQEQAQRNEEQRRREEEERRKQQVIEEELEQYRREEEARHRGEQLLPTLSEEDRRGLYERARAELSAKGYKATASIMEKIVQERVIRNLARRILSEA